MKIINYIIISIFCLSLIMLFQYGNTFASSTTNIYKNNNMILLAKAKKSKKKSKKSKKSRKKRIREKHIIREARAKSRDKRRVDFEETDISGERKVPLGSMISQKKSNKEFDLIKIRTSWHPEMIRSTSDLETGGVR